MRKFNRPQAAATGSEECYRKVLSFDFQSERVRLSLAPDHCRSIKPPLPALYLASAAAPDYKGIPYLITRLCILRCYVCTYTERHAKIRDYSCEKRPVIASRSARV